MRATGSVSSRTDRQIGWLISLSLVVMLGGRIPLILDQQALFAGWWNLGGLIGVALIVATAAAGPVLPMPLLRLIWGTASGLVLLMLYLSGGAYTGRGDMPVPWLWSVEPVTVTLPLLLIPLPWVIAGALLSGLSVALSGALFLGYVPEPILALTPPHVSNVAFVVIFLGIRVQLSRLRDAEEQARLASEEKALTQAATAGRERVAALIHDEVLAVLNAAMLFRGETPPVLRAEARTAMAVLAQRPVPSSGAMLPVDEAAIRLASSARRTWAACTVTAETANDGRIPEATLTEVGHAMTEAIRNSRLHSGADTADVSIRVQGSPPALAVSVRDGGLGFDPSTVDHAARLGLGHSISRRMQILGGASEVHSQPGRGTEVRLTWSA